MIGVAAMGDAAETPPCLSAACREAATAVAADAVPPPAAPPPGALSAAEASAWQALGGLSRPDGGADPKPAKAPLLAADAFTNRDY
jgi:hypothetical protein